MFTRRTADRHTRPRAGTTLAVCLSLALPLAGCSGGPRAGISAKQAAASVRIVPEDWSKLGYRVDWQGYPHVSRGGYVQYFQAHDDVIVTLDSANVLSVLESSSGWSRGPGIPLGTATERFVGMVRLGDTLWACSESEVHAIDLVSLDVENRQRLDKIVSTGPAAVGPVFVFGTRSGEIRAHSVLYNFGAWQNATNGRISTNPVLTDGAVAVVSDTGSVVFLNPADGTTIYRNSIHDGTSVPLASGEGILFIASRDQALYAFTPGNPYYLWRQLTPAPLNDRPVYIDGRVYCVLPGTGLTAFRATSGEQHWTCDSVTSGHVVAMQDGTLIVWNGTEAISVDAETGDEIARITVPGVGRIETDHPIGGNLFLIGSKGSVTRLRPRS